MTRERARRIIQMHYAGGADRADAGCLTLGEIDRRGGAA